MGWQKRAGEGESPVHYIGEGHCGAEVHKKGTLRVPIRVEPRKIGSFVPMRDEGAFYLSF